MSELKELVTTERFNEIAEARKQAKEDHRSVKEAVEVGRISDQAGRRLYQRSVDAYVSELEYLLNPPDSDEVNKYWDSENVGQIPLPDGRIYAVEGLGEYLDLPQELTVEIDDIEREHYYQLGTPTTTHETVQPSWRLLKSAFRTANAAATDLGMELELEHEDDTVRFREIKDKDEINPEEWDEISFNGQAAENGAEK